MGLPSKKRTPRSKKERASHFALKTTLNSVCEKCGASKLSHRACAKCGTYRGKTVIDVEKRTKRLLKKQRKTK